MRLLDLRCHWALQYATASTQYDPEAYAEIPARLGRLDGYLTTVGAAVLPCGRKRSDWEGQPDPWQALRAMLARYEAEFSGRLLIGPEDVARWLAEPDDFLCWGMLGIDDLDALIRDESDLPHLNPLFDRGVRVFRPVADDWPGPLRRRFLQELAGLAKGGGPRPVLDLAGMRAEAAAEALAWLESDAAAGRLLLVHSHGEPSFDLGRFRALGGLLGVGVGKAFAATADELAGRIEAIAAIPFRGRPGFEGLAIATNFLEAEEVVEGLGNAEQVLAWLAGRFGGREAAMLAWGNAEPLFREAAGAPSPAPPPEGAPA
ncbi:hypothetical protein OJF2_27880 [Aquisphaera giovannonii]|uniref:Amidohydrolase n=1 Tax=Aquisphaera giovannonii TaxID=406548 RepID=A0A5B9W130_9BACT|nr:Zn-dependent dipeptidase, microsomal dipeptidase [Aquisphaera giovannonii]QEH34253.1 hypothetical protein OJF2_27880 [Aquisphaera giovannonii]